MEYIRFTKITKVFYWCILGIILLSVFSAYYKYIIINDYEVFVEYDADGTIINIEEEEEY